MHPFAHLREKERERKWERQTNRCCKLMNPHLREEERERANKRNRQISGAMRIKWNWSALKGPTSPAHNVFICTNFLNRSSERLDQYSFLLHAIHRETTRKNVHLLSSYDSGDVATLHKFSTEFREKFDVVFFRSLLSLFPGFQIIAMNLTTDLHHH